MPTATITDPALWLPRGRYAAPIVVGPTADLIRITHDNAGVRVEEHITDDVWSPAEPDEAAAALEQVALSPFGAFRDHGRLTGYCGCCGDALSRVDRLRGAHEGRCERLRFDTGSIRELKSKIHSTAVRELVALWLGDGSHCRQALWNAGPVTVENLYAALRRIEAGLPVDGDTFTPQQPVKFRFDPRYEDQVDNVLARLNRAGVGQFAQAWRPVSVPVMRHVIACLTGGGRVKFEELRCDGIGQARERLAEIDADGATILHGSLSCLPALYLTVTYRR